MHGLNVDIANIDMVSNRILEEEDETTMTGSMCTGLGVQEWSYEELGVATRCLFGCEVNPKAAAVCQATHDMDKFYVDCTSEEFLNDAPAVDILTAGFPCQSFSSDGARLGFQDLRGQVVYSIVEYMRRNLPKAVILENVPGILGPEFRPMLDRVIQEISTILDEDGKVIYVARHQVLNCKAFGIPQNRPRVYFVILMVRKVKTCIRMIHIYIYIYIYISIHSWPYVQRLI